MEFVDNVIKYLKEKKAELLKSKASIVKAYKDIKKPCRQDTAIAIALTKNLDYEVERLDTMITEGYKCKESINEISISAWEKIISEEE